MEIKISNVDLKDNDQADQLCRLTKIPQKFENAIWNRTKSGYVITV